MDQDASTPRLDKTRHVKYWTRCVKSLLPHHYTNLDSNRMYLGYFILAALDLLDCLESACGRDERSDFVDWIYRCQHPNGGFRMWRGTDFGSMANESNSKWDPANVPATYFALVTLLVLGDDFKRVKRKQTLQWIRQMQRSDGSFGETLVEGQIEGGNDPRYGYCATGARYILRGTDEGPLNLEGETVQDIDVDSLVECIRSAESFDGGIADQPLNEPHAGYTYCSLGALGFVGRLCTAELPATGPTPHQGPSNPQEVVRWLVYRQTDLLDPYAPVDPSFSGPTKSSVVTDRELETILPTHAGTPGQNDQPDPPCHLDPAHGTTVDFASTCAGMNGRINKAADTCYAWWSGASLHILGQPNLYDRSAVQSYLLEITQHPVTGGFGKFPDDMPDLYHSYLGLAALSLTGSTEVKKVDAGMCISQDAKARLQGVWRAWGVNSPTNQHE